MNLNEQQQDLIHILELARLDLEAGRPAERTAHALRAALAVADYDDLTRGEANDEHWRITRIDTRYPR